MRTSPPKQTKTYWIITQDDDLYKNKKFKTYDTDGTTLKEIDNPTADTDTNGVWYFRFPEPFIQSKNRRWIVVQHVLEAHNEDDGNYKQGGMEMTNDVLLHASFIKRDAYLDHTVMLCNEVRTKYKKYEYTSADPEFTVWFTSFAESDFKFTYQRTRFFIEMMLIY